MHAVLLSLTTFRKDRNDSMNVKIKRKEANSLIIEPKDATMFQTKKASGYSVYLRGNPCNPAK